jgi:hypothetical protein
MLPNHEGLGGNNNRGTSMKTTRTIFAGIGTLALIGGLAACGTAKAPVAKDEADSYYAGAGSSCAFAKAVLQAWVNAGGESAPAGQAVGVDVSGINEICNEEGAGTVICTADSGYYEVMS